MRGVSEVPALRKDPALAGKLDALRTRWKNDTPDREWSALTDGGETVYVARYPEGVVLRLGPSHDGPVTFLTNEMAFEMWQELATRT